MPPLRPTARCLEGPDQPVRLLLAPLPGDSEEAPAPSEGLMKNPITVYRRWRFRRRCEQAGIAPDLADRINEIGRKANLAGIEAAMLIAELAMQGYSGEALLMEMRRRLGGTITEA